MIRLILILSVIHLLFSDNLFQTFEIRSIINNNNDNNDDNDDNKLINRFQYHQQGLNGQHPMSYRFGFVADDHQNPLSHHEISYSPGHVIGSYSFIDANNKWQIIQYQSHPKKGFRIVKQWTKDRQR